MVSQLQILGSVHLIQVERGIELVFNRLEAQIGIRQLLVGGKNRWRRQFIAAVEFVASITIPHGPATACAAFEAS